jgi:hypothetical protein
MWKLGLVILLLTTSVARAQGEVEVLGTGETGTIAYGETVTGMLEVSNASNLEPIRFVGHNGKDRVQGDFDVWYLDTQQGDNLIIRATATDGAFAPTLLVTYEDQTSITHIVGVVTLDDNVDGDAEAGVCLRDIPQNNQYGIVVYRQETAAVNYSLSVEQVDSAADLSGDSETAVCSVGTLVYSRGDYAVNIRSDSGTKYAIKGKMQPGQPYSFLSGYVDEWTVVGFFRPDGYLDSGYVRTRLIRITGTMDDADEPAEASG